MDPITMGLIAGGANLIGSVFSSETSAQNSGAQIQAQQQMQQNSEAFNAAEAEKSRTFSADQAEIQRAYQTTMSNSAYQRASADMRAAGLNPMMMFGSGSAASSPSGSMPGTATASTSTPTVPTSQRASPLAGLGDAVSRGLQSAINVKQVEKMSDEIANLQTERLKIAAETRTEGEKPESIRASTVKTRNEAEQLAALYPVYSQQGRSAKSLEQIPDWLRNTLDIGGFAGDKASKGLAPLSDLISSASRARWLLDRRWP